VRRAALGVGDDCALLNIRPGMQLAVSTDLLVEGRHFLSTVDPARLGHKALAVNLSDLAACGAEPLAFTLSLSMPRPDERFLAPFAEGLLALADRHGIELVGGDTTAGPLTLGITVMGEVPPGQALRRSGAQAGDVLWVSGFPGEARLALEVFRGTLSLSEDDFQAARRAMELPEPRVALGLALRGLATAAIDVSDGLLGDLGHVLRASGVGAVLHLADFPRRPLLARQPLAVQRMALLTGGDDYELLFTAPEAAGPAVQAAAAQAGVPVQAIGRITATPACRPSTRPARRWTWPAGPPSTTSSHEPARPPRHGVRRPRPHRDHPPRRRSRGRPAAAASGPLAAAALAAALGLAGHGQRPVAGGARHGRHAVGLAGLARAGSLAEHGRLGAVLVAGFFVGWWACTATARALRVADPSCVVWDEVLAFWLILWIVTPAGWGLQLAAFVLFRLFDAVKVGPVGWADRLFKAAPGQPRAGPRASASSSTTWWRRCAP
jgi:thiamine-monophosphate kinase